MKMCSPVQITVVIESNKTNINPTQGKYGHKRQKQEPAACRLQRKTKQIKYSQFTMLFRGEEWCDIVSYQQAQTAPADFLRFCCVKWCRIVLNWVRTKFDNKHAKIAGRAHIDPTSLALLTDTKSVFRTRFPSHWTMLKPGAL